MRKALLDAGPMVALFDPGDDFHSHYITLLGKSEPGFLLYTTWPCVAEASHLLEPAACRALLLWIARGAAMVYAFEQARLGEMVPVMDQYSERGRTRMDFADASLWWVARHSRVTTVLTVDHRDFSRYRLPNGRRFDIL